MGVQGILIGWGDICIGRLRGEGKPWGPTQERTVFGAVARLMGRDDDKEGGDGLWVLPMMPLTLSGLILKRLRKRVHG